MASDADPSAVQKRALATQGVERLSADRVMGNRGDDVAVVCQRDDRRKVGHRGSKVACAVNRVDDPRPSLVNISLVSRFLAQDGHGGVFSVEDVGYGFLGRNVYGRDYVAAAFRGNGAWRAKAACQDRAGYARCL